MKKNEKIKNPLPGYKFSINDFRREQLERLKEFTNFFGGNSLFKKELRSDISLQLQEKYNFYSKVRKARLDAFTLNRFGCFMKKLHAPEVLLNMLSGYSHANLALTLEKWESPGTLDDIISQKCPEENLIAALPPNASSFSGWERLKQAFFPSFCIPDYSHFESSHVYNRNCFIDCCLGTGLLVGLTMGFSYGKQYERDFYKTRGSNMYASGHDAVRSRHRSFLQGYGRYAFRWGWRYAFLAGSVYLISQGLAIYRLRDSFSHYMIASILPFSLYKWYRGPRGMLVYGAVGGIFIGLPLSFLCCALRLNPRSVYYDAGVYPEASSKLSILNWDEEEKELNKFRFNALVKELEKPDDVVDKEKPSRENVYGDLFSNKKNLKHACG